MRITESKLRKIIRQVIKESAGESYSWYSDWVEATEKIKKRSLSKISYDCLNDFGISHVDINSNDSVVYNLTKFQDRGISESELTSILYNISSVPAVGADEMSRLNLMFTATVGLLIENGKLKVNFGAKDKKALKQMKPGEMAIVGAIKSGNDKLLSCLIYEKPGNHSTVDTSNYFVIEQNPHNHEIFDRKEAGNIRRYNEKQQADYLKRRKAAELERERENRRYVHI